MIILFIIFLSAYIITGLYFQQNVFSLKPDVSPFVDNLGKLMLILAWLPILIAFMIVRFVTHD